MLIHNKGNFCAGRKQEENLLTAHKGEELQSYWVSIIGWSLFEYEEVVLRNLLD